MVSTRELSTRNAEKGDDAFVLREMRKVLGLPEKVEVQQPAAIPDPAARLQSLIDTLKAEGATDSKIVMYESSLIAKCRESADNETVLRQMRGILGLPEKQAAPQPAPPAAGSSSGSAAGSSSEVRVRPAGLITFGNVLAQAQALTDIAPAEAAQLENRLRLYRTRVEEMIREGQSADMIVATIRYGV